MFFKISQVLQESNCAGVFFNKVAEIEIEIEIWNWNWNWNNLFSSQKSKSLQSKYINL